MEEEEETMEEDSGATEEISVEEDLMEAREVEAMAAVTMEEIKEEGLAREELEEVLDKVVEVGDREDLTWDQQPT